ncbi:T9SS type A sorting domain-containing protein [bacterium]|nr:T9SS type A sorting domain-containing protein [bacterium]
MKHTFIIIIIISLSSVCFAWQDDAANKVWSIECGTSPRWVDSLHTTWARILYTTSAWGTIQPTSLDSFEFDALDGHVITLDTMGVNVLMTLITGGPRHAPCQWVDTTYEPDIGVPVMECEHASCPPLNLDDWYNFVYTVARRYNGESTNDSGDTLPEIRYYETQAEANQGFWYGTKEEYWDELMPCFYRAVHAGNPRAKVIGGSNLGETCITWAAYRMAHPYSGEPYSEEEILTFINRGYEWAWPIPIWSSLEALDNYWTQPGPARNLEFIEYSFSHDSLYDIRGVHNYNHYSTVPGITREERIAMAHYGEIKPFIAMEMGGMGCIIHTGLPTETEEANRVAKKMLLFYTEGFDVVSIFGATSAWVPPIGCVCGLTNLGFVVDLREAGYSWLLITKLLPGYGVRVFDHSNMLPGSEERYYFRSADSDSGLWDLAVTWNDSLDSTITAPTSINIPDYAETLIIYDYLGDSVVRTGFGDTVSLEVGILPVFIRLIGGAAGIREDIIPDNFEISCYPNPFNAMVNIKIAPSVETLHAASLQAIIYDINGREIGCLDEWTSSAKASKLEMGGWMGFPGSTVFFWQPNAFTPSGIYFIKVNIGDRKAVKKVLYLK